jgi:hypothetical protein
MTGNIAMRVGAHILALPMVALLDQGDMTGCGHGGEQVTEAREGIMTPTHARSGNGNYSG